MTNTQNQQPMKLWQAVANSLLALIIDTKLTSRDEVVQLEKLTMDELHDICKAFNLSLSEVLELAQYELDDQLRRPLDANDKLDALADHNA